MTMSMLELNSPFVLIKIHIVTLKWNKLSRIQTRLERIALLSMVRLYSKF